MKKLFSKGKILFIATFCVMAVAVTASVCFAYWKAGLRGNTNDSETQIDIGTGESVTSEVTFASVSSDAEGRQLIPQDKIAGEGQTTAVSFTFNVRWIWDDAADYTEAFKDYTGLLSVICDSIETVANPGVNLAGVKGAGGEPLFVLTLPSSQSIAHNNPYGGTAAADNAVVITVRMNEPVNREQYDEVAGQNIKFRFTFTVVSPDDLNP